MMIWKKIKIPIINKYVWSNKWNITIKKEFTETNLKSLQKAFVYIESNLIDSDGGMYLTVDSLIEINYIIADSNKTALIKVNVKPYGFDKINVDKELIEDKLYQIISMKSTSAKFYSLFLNKIQPFYDGNGWMRKILFANDDIIRQNI